MRTPKRDVPFGPFDPQFDQWEGPNEDAFCAQRWQRKNRIAQLKRSLHKYKEGTMLPKLQALRLAYTWIQELKEPRQDAEVIHWFTYLSDLKTIQGAINRAVEHAATCLGVAIERKERKELEK